MKLNEAVGEFLSCFRKEHGLTLDQIATASQQYGSGWSTGTLSLMERGGSKADSLATLILLVQSLNDLTNSDMTLADLFDRLSDLGVEVELTDSDSYSVAIPVVDIRDMLNGEHFKLTSTPAYGSDKWHEMVDRAWNEARSIARDMRPPIRDSEEHERMKRHVPTLAEKRASKRIGVTPEIFGYWCISVYGHSLDDEAAARAGDDATPQKKGRVTRSIIAEIKAKVDTASEWRAEQLLNGDL